MNECEKLDVYGAMRRIWPTADVRTAVWEEYLEGMSQAAVLAALAEMERRSESFPTPPRLKAMAAGFANLDKGVCRLCDNTGFIFETEPLNTVRPCDRCRPEVYSRWLAGAYRSKNTPAERTESFNEASRVRLDEARERLSP